MFKIQEFCERSGLEDISRKKNEANVFQSGPNKLLNKLFITGMDLSRSCKGGGVGGGVLRFVPVMCTAHPPWRLESQLSAYSLV